MANKSSGRDGLVDRRAVLQVAGGLAAAGPTLLRGANAEAQQRPQGAPHTTIIDSQLSNNSSASKSGLLGDTILHRAASRGGEGTIADIGLSKSSWKRV